VDIVVVRAGVVRVAAQNGFEHGDDLFGPLLGLADGGPELPGPQVHRAFGVERGRVQVVRILAGQLAHRFLVRHGQLLAVGLWVRAVALRQSPDVVALRLGGLLGQLQGLAQRLVSRLPLLVVRVKVVVRSLRQRDAPVRHRQAGIEVGSAGEGPPGLVVVEGVKQDQPLVEELLRLGAARRHGMVMASKAGHQRRRAAGFDGRMIGASETAQQEEQRDTELLHGFGPP
jgi:hypothetical protein